MCLESKQCSCFCLLHPEISIQPVAKRSMSSRFTAAKQKFKFSCRILAEQLHPFQPRLCKLQSHVTLKVLKPKIRQKLVIFYMKAATKANSSSCCIQFYWYRHRISANRACFYYYKVRCFYTTFNFQSNTFYFPQILERFN